MYILKKSIRYPYGTNANYIHENKTEYNSKWPYIPDHPYRRLITGGFVSGKPIALLILIKILKNTI